MQRERLAAPEYRQRQHKHKQPADARSLGSEPLFALQRDHASLASENGPDWGYREIVKNPSATRLIGLRVNALRVRRGVRNPTGNKRIENHSAAGAAIGARNFAATAFS
ncbi:MAG: hypothetical protein WA417_07820, partial [Stellaceae bacterium]